MKYIIVNSSTNIEHRVDLIYEYLKDRGHEVTVMASDYVHAKKAKRTEAAFKHPYVLVDTKPYQKNISIARLYSHDRFSRDVFKQIKNVEADVLYLIVPQNSNAKIAKWYRKKHPNTRIVIDIVDMWPESLPIKGTEYFPFTLWANVRNQNLKYADLIVTECDYYQERLKRFLAGKNAVTLPWLKRNRPWNSRFEDSSYRLPEDKISLCYLGAVNNIIDMKCIQRLIAEIKKEKPVDLHIIGIGERKNILIDAAETAGATVYDYGAVYDENKKQEIMDRCHFGLNLMKDTVCVGLSMKSIDYMAAGLPIINNLPGDSRRLVEESGIGVNLLTEGEAIKDISFIYDTKPFDRKKIRKLFEICYSADLMNDYLKQIGM